MPNSEKIADTVRCDTAPYTPAVPAITAELVVEQAEQLGEGSHHFTARQLYYACCAAAEAPHPSATKGIIGLSAILILLGAIFVRLAPPVAIILGLIGVAGLLFAVLNAHTERAQAAARAEAPRPLALSYDGFTAGPLREALAASPERLGQLVGLNPDRPAAPARPARGRPASGRRPRGALLLACDREETGRLLAANLPHLPAGTEVVVLAAESGGPSPAASAAGGGARAVEAGSAAAAVRRRRVLAIHDADPQGCALPARLRRAGAAGVVDVGLRPPSSDARLAVLEGAPARLPSGIEEDLGPDEVGWLRSGRRLELATLSPAEIVARIAAAVPVSPARSLRPARDGRRIGPPDPAQAEGAAPSGSQIPAR
jgi:hypothetical protein